MHQTSRRAVRSVLRPDRTTTIAMALVAVALALTTVALGLAVRSTGRTVDYFTGDVSQTAGLPWHVGLLSTAGVLLWGAATVVAGLVSLLLLRDDRGADRAVGRSMAAGAAISGYFLLDDLILLHDELYPRLFDVQDLASYSVYSAALLAWLWFSRRTLLASAGLPLLLLALAGFAASNGFDVFGIPGEFGEEGLKLAGIAFWFAFFVRVAMEELTVRPATPAPAPAHR